MTHKTNTKNKIILLVITVVIVITIVEIGLRASYYSYANYNTEMWRYAKELKQKSDFPEQDHHHIKDKEVFLYGVNFKTNSLGFRADREFITPNTDNITRILVLGDSITVGWGVKVNESYPARLQTMLNKVGNYEVINTGVGNYNTKRELATLQKHIDLEPDIIILGFFINDIEEVEYCKTLCWIQKNSYAYAFIYDRFVKLKYGGQNSFKDYYSELYKDESLKNSLTNDIRTIYEIANNESAKLVLVNIPELHEFEEYPFTEVNEFIEQDIITDLNITYINLLPSFSNHSPNDLWVSFEDAHPNAKGHQIIAKKIFKEVFENG